MKNSFLRVALPTLVAAHFAAGVADAATFTVNSGNDVNDGTCNGTHCSLREAINAANAAGGLDTIAFTGLGIITPTSALPTITSPVLLDGGPTATPAVQITGASAGAGANGLVLGAGSSGSTVRLFVIRNFQGAGVVVQSDNNTLQRVWVGLGANGSDSVGNGGYGFSVSGNGNNLGTAAGYAERVISSNNGGGIQITGGSNTVQFSYVGTTYLGAAPAGNTGTGILISGASATNNVFKQLVVASSGADGVRIASGASGNSFETNNLIGMNSTGDTPFPNIGSGISIVDSNGNFIGKAGGGNVISGNVGPGVSISGTSSGNFVRANNIGIRLGATAVLPNTGAGVSLSGGSNNAVGTAGIGNLISGNGAEGIKISGGTGHLVLANVIGTNPGGTAAWANAGAGVSVTDSASLTIGQSAETATGNLISGNGGSGISVSGASSTGLIVRGNTVGTNVNGTGPVPNTLDGVTLSSVSGATIGGSVSGEDNVIGSNGRHGVFVTGGTGHTIGTNEIGIDGTGNVDVGNQGHGVYLNGCSSSTVRVNLLSGNHLDGLRIEGGGSNVVIGQVDGVNITGNTAVPNDGNGLSIVNSSNNQIGQVTAGNGNTFSGNGGHGIWISGASSTGNSVYQTNVGTNVAANALVGNAGWGILIESGANNIVGGPAVGEPCYVKGNGSGGIGIRGASGNRVRRNYVSSNTGLGIDLDADGALPMDGVTGNDAGDGDAGANALQNYPVITSSNTTTVSGTLNSTPSTTFTVDVYGNTACDASGYGEGNTILGSTSISTDGSGNAPWSVSFGAQPVGTVYTATATGPTGNTSEFSLCNPVPSGIFPGSVPDRNSLGAPLIVRKNGSNAALIDLSWGTSCANGFTGYAIYQGTVGTWYGHDRFNSICNLGATSATGQTPGSGDRYYLVVPVSTTNTEEGSYGKTSANVEIPRAITPCQPSQDTGGC